MNTESRYRLVRFEDPLDAEFLNAISLYAEHTNPSIRTNTNEIIHWLDAYSRFHKDEMFLFGFYLNDELIGFAQAVYFAAPQILVIDYLVIIPERRGSNVFFEFMEHLRTFVLRSGKQPRFAVAEVAHYSDTEVPHAESRLLVRLLKFAGFKVLKAPYYQPLLGLAHYESKMRATLMLYSLDPPNQIAVPTYLQIVRTIYFDHYLRWYGIYEESRDLYASHIEELYSELKKWAENRDSVALNGTTEAVSLPLPTSRISEVSQAQRFAAWSLAYLLVSAAVTILIKEFANLSLVDVLLTIVALLAVYVILLSTVLERLQPLGERLIEHALRIFGRLK